MDLGTHEGFLRAISRSVSGWLFHCSAACSSQGNPIHWKDYSAGSSIRRPRAQGCQHRKSRHRIHIYGRPGVEARRCPLVQRCAGQRASLRHPFRRGESTHSERRRHRQRAPRSFVGPNGMIAGKDGAVLLCQHTNRRIVRVGQDLTMTPHLEKFEGHRFNSPNDLIYRSDGTLYFTDPPYGLLKQDDDPAKELTFNGVFLYRNGRLQAIIKDLTRPNGIALSPDEKTLYVANSDEKKRFWMRYDVAADGTVSNGRIFYDLAGAKEQGIPDGLKEDSQGNIYAAGPEGVWVFSPNGTHLGTIQPGETAANCAWGQDGKTLYITASTSVYRIRVAIPGEKPLYQVYQ